MQRTYHVQSPLICASERALCRQKVQRFKFCWQFKLNLNLTICRMQFLSAGTFYLKSVLVGTAYYLQACHQIREIIQGKQRKFRMVLVHSNDFLHTQLHIRLSVTIAKIFTLLYIILFCAVLIKHSPVFYERKN